MSSFLSGDRNAVRGLALIGGLALFVCFVWVLGVPTTHAEPGAGNSTDQCLLCHKGDPGAWAVAVSLHAEVHDSAVGECATCHTYEDESIHGQWGDTPEACARCHRTHSAVEDDLLAMGKDELCLFCHGRGAGLAQTDVLDGLLRLGSVPLRGGGFDEATMNTNTNLANSTDPGYSTSTAEWYFPVSGALAGNVTSRHTLGVEATIWGSWNAYGFSETPNAGDTNTILQCVSCHDPHAYGLTYRMLTRRPADSGVAKHPGNNSDPWEQRVFVTDQLTYARWNPLSDILSYTTGDYSNTEIGNKTWNAGNATWIAALQPGTSYAAPDVVDPDTGVIEVSHLLGMSPMYSQQISQWCASCHDRYHAEQTDHSAPGSTDSGDAIFAYRHKTGDSPPVWDEADGEYESFSCGYGCHSSRQLNCLGCHVAHGTAAQMTPYVTAMSWPGQSGGHYDTLDNGTTLGNATLQVDTRPEFTGGTDHDWEARSNLLRLDNRGVCQNPACHPKGKDSYLEPYDGVEDLCIECHAFPDAHDGIGDTDCSVCHTGSGPAGGSCDGCHGAPPATGAHITHFGGDASLAAYGGTTNLSSAGDYNFQCGSCHPLSSESHMNDTVDIELYNAAAPEGSLKSLNPLTASYVPGGTAYADPDGIGYTLGACSDVYCHSKTDWSAPGPVGYPLTDPGSGYLMLDVNGNMVYDPYTVTEFKVYSSVGWGDSALDCNGCHRNNPRTADPWQGGNVVRGVGNSHEWVGMWGYGNYHAWNMGFDPVMCRSCHNDTVTEAMTWTRDGMDRTTFDDVPIANKASHANGVKDVVFDPVNPVPMKYPEDLSSTTYDLDTKVCSNVPCHKNQPNPEWGKPYDFYNSPECDQCHRYGGANWPPVVGEQWPAAPAPLSMMEGPMTLGAAASQAPASHPGNPGQDCSDCHDGHGPAGQ